MKKSLTKTTESALVVRVIDEPYFTAPVFSLAQAQEFVGKAKRSIDEDGGDSIAGAIVYHPTKGMVAYISPNCRVWKAENESVIGRGGLTEYSDKEAGKHFSQLFL
jgi:hypothetical protein